MKKDLNDIIRDYRTRGWVVEKTNGGHWCFRGPCGRLVYSSTTPSDWRALRNLKAQLEQRKRDIGFYCN